MDNHPIPQDITNFQFKLIGDMTLKQFAYLAAGVVLAWIIFSSPVNFLIKLPISSIIAFFGISFAFFSISGRPMDVMILNFMRATFSPTKYIYQKPAISSPLQPKAQEQQINIEPVVTPVSSQSSRKNELDKKEFDFFRMLSQMLHPASQPHMRTIEENAPAHPFVVSAKVQGEKKLNEAPRYPDVQEETAKEESLDEETKTLQEELKKAVANEKANQGLPTYDEAHKKALEVEKNLNQTLLEKQQLEMEIIELRKQLESQKEVYVPSKTMPKSTPNVRTITTSAEGKSAGLPTIPEFPNIITGIIKDPRGNPLSNILVEVKDTEGNPVRAFKTNPLGQFQASTPLANGSYTIEFEDPNSMNKFDKIAFQAAGEVIPPIEVFSIDTREELRKSLFTN